MTARLKDDWPGAEPWMPERTSLTSLREGAAECRDCDLYRDATQVGMGEGSRTASLMLLGEQPGDQEDQAGEPFVGPAGRVLDRALAAAGIDPDDTYVTNVVKHFRWHPSTVLRTEDREEAFAVLVADLEVAAAALATP